MEPSTFAGAAAQRGHEIHLLQGIRDGLRLQNGRTAERPTEHLGISEVLLLHALHERRRVQHVLPLGGREPLPIATALQLKG